MNTSPIAATSGRPRGGRRLLLLSGLMAVAILAGCQRSAPAGAAPGPMEVGVVTVTPAPVALTRELPGRTSAYRVAEVRARVSGIVQKRNFVEGSEVSAGEVLFEIDAAPYQAALDNAKGVLARAEANATVAGLQAKRYHALIDSQAISQQDYDNAVATEKSAIADVAAAQASVETAEINLGYTRVTSPVSGRIGRSEVTEGAYVQAGQATLLATVQSLDHIYVDFTQSNTELLRLKRALAAGQLQSAGASRTTVRLVLEDGSLYGAEGMLQFTDVTVDQSTGSILLRALFPNPQGELLPGMFVRAQIVEGENPAAILVPQTAVSRDSRGQATVYVIGANDLVEVRVLKTDRTVGDRWLVNDGLKAGERVIVEGLQRIRPGMPVKAVAAGETPRTVAAR